VNLFVTAMLAGLAIGSIYGLVGVGLTIVYNTTKVFNLAQGDLVMVGIMSSFWLLDLHQLPQVVDLPLVIAITTLVAAFEERVVVRPFLREERVSSLGWMIATLGFAVVVETIVIVRLGGGDAPIPSPIPLGGFHVGGVILVYRSLYVIGAFVVLISLLGFFFQRTWLGQAMRATSQDREAAGLRGINPVATARTAFLLAGVSAGIAGYVIGPTVFANPTVGLGFTLKGFLALAIGGFGSIRGAVAGGLLLGVAEQLFDTYVDSNFEVMVGVALVLLVLTVRPQGLFKAPTTRTV
jgi:branched-chain amino acid transport system permease protein